MCNTAPRLSRRWHVHAFPTCIRNTQLCAATAAVARKAEQACVRREKKRTREVSTPLMTEVAGQPIAIEGLGSITLPRLLWERARCIMSSGRSVKKAPGRFVLYWMQTCLRVHHNPALLTAAFISRQLKQPLLVVFTLPSSVAPRYWSTARRIAFAIQSAKDCDSEIRRISGSSRLHVYADEGLGLEPIKQLQGHAHIVITEDMPTEQHPAIA